MTNWEDKRRKELEKSIKPGYYQIGGPGYMTQTGKYGYINYLIEMERTSRKYAKILNNKE